jgi:hypothetical protein
MSKANIVERAILVVTFSNEDNGCVCEAEK